MNNEESRLRTFRNWPPTLEVEPVTIAKAGFFYTGQGVEVQCFRCGGKISEWNPGDQVMSRHRRLDPQCPFVLNPATSGDVPIPLPGEPPASTAVPAPPVSAPAAADPTEEAVETNRDEIYKNDSVRLLSFIHWPVTYISRESLALAGFYYLGGDEAVDKVRCAWCGGELENWLRGDKPMQEHLRHYPHCQYARDKARSFNRTDITSSQVCNNDLLIQSNMSELGIQSHKVVRQHKYFTYESRLASFENWPSTLVQKPDTMAAAGFYYIGSTDQVRCFHCDGGLCRWMPTDDPWIEHAKWFSNCGYVLQKKGKDFIDRHKSTTAVGGNGGGRVWLVREAEVEDFMSSSCALAALHCGLQPERVRRAIRVRLQETGTPFSSPDALIDAALNEQINETPFGNVDVSSSPRASSSLRYALDNAVIDHVTRIIDSALSEGEVHAPSNNVNSAPVIRSNSNIDRPPRNNPTSNIESAPSETINPNNVDNSNSGEDVRKADAEPQKEKSDESVASEAETPHNLVKSSSSNSAELLEEENRLLKEARMCKVCMDAEVGVVFLPCGHLVSCVLCASCLPQCPLCRANVKGVVRTYLS